MFSSRPSLLAHPSPNSATTFSSPRFPPCLTSATTSSSRPSPSSSPSSSTAVSARPRRATALPAPVLAAPRSSAPSQPSAPHALLAPALPAPRRRSSARHRKSTTTASAPTSHPSASLGSVHKLTMSYLNSIKNVHTPALVPQATFLIAFFGYPHHHQL